MLWLFILVSGKYMEYSQAISKICDEQVAILKKPSPQILQTCGQNPFK